jgi:hypothetical protein
MSAKSPGRWALSRRSNITYSERPALGVLALNWTHAIARNWKAASTTSKARCVHTLGPVPATRSLRWPVHLRRPVQAKPGGMALATRITPVDPGGSWRQVKAYGAMARRQRLVWTGTIRACRVFAHRGVDSKCRRRFLPSRCGRTLLEDALAKSTSDPGTTGRGCPHRSWPTISTATPKNAFVPRRSRYRT